MVMRYTVVVSTRVIAKMAEQTLYLAGKSSRAIAERYIGTLFTFFDGFDVFPERGHPRPDVLPGLYIVGYQRSVNVAIVVERPYVYVVGVYFGGEDYQGDLNGQDVAALASGGLQKKDAGS